MDPGDDSTITNSTGVRLSIANAEHRPMVLVVIEHQYSQPVVVPLDVDEARFIIVALEKSISIARGSMS